MYDINPDDYDTEAIRRKLVSEIGPATPIEEMSRAELIAIETCSPYEVLMMAASYGINIEDYHAFRR